MEPIRVVLGTGTAPTEMAAYDAALADAGVGNYNLTSVSSVIPAGATIEVVDTAPDLGPAGERLTVVQAKAVAAPGDECPACAGLGWSVSGDDPGLFYESSGTDSERVHRMVREGLAAGERLRDWTFERREDRVAVADPDPTVHAAAVALAAYGTSEPLL